MGEARRVPLRTLRLDPRNPRLPPNLVGHDQEELAVHLELAFDALTVARSIASHGFFGSEPLIVVAGDEPGTWTVVEGNRRLTALLGLLDPEVRAQFANPGPWNALAEQTAVAADDLVPVVVLPDRKAATPIIGFRHISGILQWQPYAQARYIANLVHEDGLSFEEVAETTGIDRTKVGNLYRDQAIAEQARRLGLETGPVENAFSLLTVAMSTPKLRDHVGAPLGSRLSPGADPIPAEKADALRELLTWIYGDGETEPVIGDSREISKLGNVVANTVGLGALRHGDSLDMALQKVKDADLDPRQRLVHRLRTARNSLNGAIEDVADFADDAEVAALVDDARGATDALLTALGRD
ncbi:MAG TPA: hypothetical protein VFQ85_07795 [Mycobacteriales bacterium]|nr:hypothetical protein [Mycobacteriales bacterium]